MSLVVVERQTARSMTGRQMVESSRGWLQQPETSDGRQIIDDMTERVAQSYVQTDKAVYSNLIEIYNIP